MLEVEKVGLAYFYPGVALSRNETKRNETKCRAPSVTRVLFADVRLINLPSSREGKIWTDIRTRVEGGWDRKTIAVWNLSRVLLSYRPLPLILLRINRPKPRDISNPCTCLPPHRCPFPSKPKPRIEMHIEINLDEGYNVYIYIYFIGLATK